MRRRTIFPRVRAVALLVHEDALRHEVSRRPFAKRGLPSEYRYTNSANPGGGGFCFNFVLTRDRIGAHLQWSEGDFRAQMPHEKIL